MPVKVKHFTDIIKNKFKDKKSAGIIVVLGMLGILLIAFSDSFSFKKTSDDNDKSLSSMQYINYLEEKITKTVSCINGAGKTRVMITLESSSEQKFVFNNSDEKNSEKNGEQLKTNNTTNTETVIIDGEGGYDEPLIEKTIEPKIRGVLVLCEGADNIELNEKITKAVKTALGISSNKVCVIKLK